MTKLTTKPDSVQPATEMAVDLFDNWFDPIETEVRARSRQFIEELTRGTKYPATVSAIRWIGSATALRLRDHGDNTRQHSIGTNFIRTDDERTCAVDGAADNFVAPSKRRRAPRLTFSVMDHPQATSVLNESIA